MDGHNAMIIHLKYKCFIFQLLFCPDLLVLITSTCHGQIVTSKID